MFENGRYRPFCLKVTITILDKHYSILYLIDGINPFGIKKKIYGLQMYLMVRLHVFEWREKSVIECYAGVYDGKIGSF